MKITLDFEDFSDELTEWAAAQKESVEDLIKALTFAHLRIFIVGKMAGSKEHHQQTIEMIKNIGKESR